MTSLYGRPIPAAVRRKDLVVPSASTDCWLRGHVGDGCARDRIKPTVGAPQYVTGSRWLGSRPLALATRQIDRVARRTIGHCRHVDDGHLSLYPKRLTRIVVDRKDLTTTSTTTTAIATTTTTVTTTDDPGR